ncbi:MAG: sulfotransferase family protein [Alphaproteobacteria bacterium]
MKRPKVFGIGFPKTGTSSLGRALQILGYRVQRGVNINRPGRPWVEPPVTREKLAALALPRCGEYDAFEDFPWMALYREADEAFPGSKFILTVRDPDAWQGSVKRHFPEINVAPLLFLCGTDGPTAAHSRFLEAYHAHNEAVRNYFRGREEDLLVWDVDRADWPGLCDFLGRRRPLLRSYPHANRAAMREWRHTLKTRGMWAALRRAVAGGGSG